MPQLTQAEIKAFLQDATGSRCSMAKYANLLGFRKLSKSKSKHGRPTYDGKVKEFYITAKRIAHELSKKYDSLSALQTEIKTQESFTESLIDDMISEYGPHIWNDGRSGFVTITDDKSDVVQEYPRHLIYSNESDRIRIRTFAYCFTLVSVSHNMRNTGVQPRGDAAGPSDFSYTAPRGPRARRSTMTARDPDTVTVEPTRTVPTTPTSLTPKENGCLDDTCEYPVPVPSMLPKDNTEGIFSSSTMPQSNTVGPSIAASSNFNAAEDHCRPTEMSHLRSPRTEWSSIEQPSMKTFRRKEETGECLPVRKRRRSANGEASDESFQSLQLSEFTGRSVRPRKGLTYDISRSTSPSVSPEDADNSADQRSRDMSSNRPTGYNANEMVSVQYQSRVDTDTNDDADDDAVAVTSVTTPHIHTANTDVHMSGDGIGEVDSVMDSPKPPPAVEEEEEDNEPTSIVELKIQSQKEIRQRQLYRVRLAAKLPSAFEMSSEQPKALEDVVKLIECIRDLEAPLSQSGSGGTHMPYQLVLDQWLRLADIYLRFRNDPDFNNDPSTWATHRNCLELAECIRKDQIINAARADIMEWSLEHDNYNMNEWSRCATSLLLDMADWGFELDAKYVEEIRGRFVNFNKSLVEGQLAFLLL